MGSERMAQYLLNHKDVVLNSVNLDEYLDAMTSTWYSELRLKQARRFPLIFLFLEDLQSQCGPLTERQQALFERYLNRTRSNVEWWDKYYPDLSRVFYDAFVIGPFDMENWNTRVPRNFKPFSYNVKIRPNFPGSAAYPWYKNMTFDGEVEMHFTVLNNVNEIQLNSHRMVVEKWNMKLTEQSTKRSYEIDDVVKDLEYGNIYMNAHNLIPAFLTLKTQAPLTAGSNWTLWIKYTGFVWGVPSKGVYTNTNYFEFNNKKAWIFSTYFESGPSARSLVPCFDEPDYKARWQMTLEHPADMIALGNMPDQGFTIQADGN
ncbi:unnamed protein product [Anisakis simplex]|uniref:Peptidase_M1_N domain-containing protein n=2 Tax=Anisakis simplex TaxID=6269 RepID=A0A0M3KEZ6_ANISI|nr:unnamed protein product [Anisakis simplex]